MSEYKFLLKYVLICIGIFFIFTGCASKKVTYNINTSLNIHNVTKNIVDNTPTFCSYRGKVAVTAGINDGEKKSFSGLLNKDCNNNALLRVLGPFNVPVAEISYKNKVINIKTSSKEQTEAIKNIADESIFQIINFIKIPFLLPNSLTYKLSYNDKAYVFTDEIGNYIEADESFKVVKIKYGDITLDYIWEYNFVKEVLVTSGKLYLKTRFFTAEGWSNKNK